MPGETKKQFSLTRAGLSTRERVKGNFLSISVVSVQDVAVAKVRLVMQRIRERSPILSEMLDKCEIGMVGGMYDLSTGLVEFYP